MINDIDYLNMFDFVQNIVKMRIVSKNISKRRYQNNNALMTMKFNTNRNSIETDCLVIEGIQKNNLSIQKPILKRFSINQSKQETKLMHDWHLFEDTNKYYDQ